MDTRLEFVKYCIPDPACHLGGYPPEGDPRRAAKSTGPYAERPRKNHNIALTWVLHSSRWRPHWRAAREAAGAPEFQEDFDDGWWYDETVGQDWRQRLWENTMVCQGWEGLGMIREGQLREGWLPRVREWREKIERLDKEPPTVKVLRQATLESPYLLGDLRCCVGGYVAGT